jgi:large subunit ribosomal protein L10
MSTGISWIESLEMAKKYFIRRGGKCLLAISKKRKNEIFEQHKAWLEESQGAVLTQYIGLNAKELERLRLKIREAGGELHVLKNTLGKLVFEAAGYDMPPEVFEGSTAISFAFSSAPDLAKAITEFASSSEFVNVKAGVLSGKVITSADVKALADLPPLPVMRAHLLGTFLAPATQLARILAEPGRQVAAVVKAYADQDVAQAAA